eukprot:4232792-Amphidinium_carterae.1
MARTVTQGWGGWTVRSLLDQTSGAIAHLPKPTSALLHDRSPGPKSLATKPTYRQPTTRPYP